MIKADEIPPSVSSLSASRPSRLLSVLLPGCVIGIIGGGQLGRMSAIAAARLGYHVHIFTDSLPSPAGEVAARITCGSYEDEELLKEFARSCDVISFEFENISAEALKKIESLCPVHPAGEILAMSQNRIAEKTRLTELGFPVAPWCPVPDFESLKMLEGFGFPLILKTARFGYDGKGQYRLPDKAGFDAFLAAYEGGASLSFPMVAERQIDFSRELSVMVARNQEGICRPFDPAENIHHDGILRISAVPAPISPDLAEYAQSLAVKLAQSLNLVGIMGVEFFHDAQGQLLINEIAARPHNSGHWTMDACIIDQFEMHIRAVVGLPLPVPRRHSDVYMHNLIGPDDMAYLPDIFREAATKIHLYGKEESRAGRKMGHVNRLFTLGCLPGRLAMEELLPHLSVAMSSKP